MPRSTIATNAAELGPASRDREARMRAMTDAAVALFSEEGYAAVSTRRIAERAGCSETLLFRYFGDKRGLLLTICNDLGTERTMRRAAQEYQEDVREFIEQYLLESFARMKEEAPPLKVVIAAFINDPAMATDFEKKHDEAVEYVSDALRRFQTNRVIAGHIDIKSMASAIEQLSFAVGFLLQLVFERPDPELRAIAAASALALSQGLHEDTAGPPVEPLRRKAVAGVRDVPKAPRRRDCPAGRDLKSTLVSTYSTRC